MTREKDLLQSHDDGIRTARISMNPQNGHDMHKIRDSHGALSSKNNWNGMLHGGSAGTNCETRNARLNTDSTVNGSGTVRNGNVANRLKGMAGGAKSQAFMKAYFDEKQKRQVHPSPVGGTSRRSVRNRPSLHTNNSNAFQSMQRGHEHSNTLETRNFRLNPEKIQTLSKKSQSSHVLVPSGQSVNRHIQQTTPSPIGTHKISNNVHGSVRSNVKMSNPEFGNMVSQNKKLKTSSSASNINGSIARKTQQKLIASTFNTLCGDTARSKSGNGGSTGASRRRRKESTSIPRQQPVPPEIIRNPDTSHSTIDPKQDKKISSQQLQTPMAAQKIDHNNISTPQAFNQSPAFQQTESELLLLRERVQQLEYLLDAERQDNIEKDIQIQQLQEIVKLKDLQIKEFEIEREIATMRNHQSKISHMDIDGRSSMNKQIVQTTGSCTLDHESRDEMNRQNATNQSRCGRELAANKSQPIFKDTGCNQSALTTTINLDDGALSAENAIAELGNAKEMIDSSCPVDESGIAQNINESKADALTLSNVQINFSNHQSNCSHKNYNSEVTKMVNTTVTGTDDDKRQSAYIDDVDDLEAVFPEEVTHHVKNGLSNNQIQGRPETAHADQYADQASKLPQFDIHQRNPSVDKPIKNIFNEQRNYIEQYDDVTEPKIIDQRNYKPPQQLLQTIQHAGISSTIQHSSPGGSQQSAWHIIPSKAMTTQFRSPEDDYWPESNKSSTLISKSAQNQAATTSFMNGSGQFAPMPVPQNGQSNQEDGDYDPYVPQVMRNQIRSQGSLPKVSTKQPQGHSNSLQQSICSLNISACVKPQNLQEETRSSNAHTSPIPSRGKNPSSWRKSGNSIQEPRKSITTSQYQTQAAAIQSTRSSRKPQTFSLKQSISNQKLNRSQAIAGNGSQSRQPGYLNHLQKQYASKNSLAINSSVGGGNSSVGRSLEKVPVNVPAIQMRSPVNRRSPKASNTGEITNEQPIHSFRGDGKLMSNEATPVSQECEQSQQLINAVQINEQKKTGQSFLETSHRSPINHKSETPIQGCQNSQFQNNYKSKTTQKPPKKIDKTVIDPSLVQDFGPTSRNNNNNITRDSSRGFQRSGNSKQVTLDSNFEFKNQTVKQPSRKINCTPQLSNRGATSARYKGGLSSNTNQQVNSNILSKAHFENSGQKQSQENQGLTQRLLNSKRVSSNRYGQPNSKVIGTKVGKTAITEPVVQKVSPASPLLENSSDNKPRCKRNRKQPARVNKNELLFQQVLKTSRERQDSLDRPHEVHEISGGAPPCEYPTKTRSRSNSIDERESNKKRSTLSESSQICEEINKDRLLFLEKNIKSKNDLMEQKFGESLQSEIEEQLPQANTTLQINATNGLGHMLASGAPSDSTSQCNYRTRDDIGVTGMPSIASAEVSLGEGLGCTQGPLVIQTCLNGTISQNGGSRGQRIPTVTSNSQPQDIQAFDYNGQKLDVPEGTPGNNFNLLSPFDIQQVQEHDVDCESPRIQNPNDPNSWAQQQSLPQASKFANNNNVNKNSIANNQMVNTKKISCQPSQMFQFPPHSPASQQSPLIANLLLPTTQEDNQNQEHMEIGTHLHQSAFNIHNQGEFDVIYEKNSIEEMENSILSKSRLSKETRQNQDPIIFRPGSQYSMSKEDVKQFAINTGPQPTARQLNIHGPRHAPTLSTGLTNVECQSKVVGSAEVQKLQYSERSIKDFNNLRELVSEFDNNAVLGTNYEEMGSAYDQIVGRTSGLKQELQDASIYKDHQKISHSHLQSSNAKRVFELKDTIQKDQDNFLMEEILAYPSERTPAKHRRSRSQRRGDPYTQSEQKSSPDKIGVVTQNIQTTMVNQFDTSIMERLSQEQASSQDEFVLKAKSKDEMISSKMLGARAPVKQRGSQSSNDDLQDHQNNNSSQKSQNSLQKQLSKNPATHSSSKYSNQIFEEEVQTVQKISNEHQTVVEDQTTDMMNHGSVELGSKEENINADQTFMSENSGNKTHSKPNSGKIPSEQFTVGNRKEVFNEQIYKDSEPNGKDENVLKCSARSSNPQHEDSMFKVENGGFYAYSGAFETFNNVIGASSSTMGCNYRNTNMLQIQTSRSAEGSQLNGDRSPSNHVFSPQSVFGLKALRCSQQKIIVSSKSAIKGIGKMSGQGNQQNGPANDDHNMSELTLQNLPQASAGPLTNRSALTCNIEDAGSKNRMTIILMQMPGIFYQTISELLGEKLPLIIFTNRCSFKTSLDSMIERYSICQSQILEHKEILQNELQNLQSPTPNGSHSPFQRLDHDRYTIGTIPEEDGDPCPSNSQYDSVSVSHQAQNSILAPTQKTSSRHLESEMAGTGTELTDEQLENELMEIQQVEMVYQGIIENIKRFRKIVN